MRAHTQSPPACPQCGAVVYRTHTCRASALAPPASHRLVPIPVDFRDRAAAARRAAQFRPLELTLELALDVEADQ